MSRYLLQDSVDDVEIAAEMAAVAMLYGFQLRVGQVRQLQIEDLVLDHDREQVIHLGGAAIMRGFGPIYQGFKHHWSSVFDGRSSRFQAAEEQDIKAGSAILQQKSPSSMSSMNPSTLSIVSELGLSSSSSK